MREIYSLNQNLCFRSRQGAYIIFPYDIRKEFGAGRVKVQATFDNVPYEGSIVNMGVKNPDGSVCYILDYEKIFVKHRKRNR